MALILNPPKQIAKGARECAPKFRGLWRGLVGAYPMQDSGTKVRDYSPKLAHGTIAGNPVWKPGGRAGRYLDFDGTGDIVRLATGRGLPLYPNTNKSIVVLVRVAAASGANLRIYADGQTGSDNPNYALHIGTTANAGFFVKNDAGGTVILKDGATNTDDSNWHAIAFSDNNGSSPFMVVDGALDATSFAYTPGTLTLDNASLGAWDGATVRDAFPDDMAMAVLYNRALSTAEAKLITTDPYGMFRRRKKLYVPGKGFIRR